MKMQTMVSHLISMYLLEMKLLLMVSSKHLLCIQLQQLYLNRLPGCFSCWVAHY